MLCDNDEFECKIKKIPRVFLIKQQGIFFDGLKKYLSGDFPGWFHAVSSGVCQKKQSISAWAATTRRNIVRG